MPKHITDNSQLKCDKGTTPSPIAVTSQTFMHIEGKLQATEEDNKPNVNIKPFGACSIMHSSCAPAPIKWQDTSVFEIDGKKELLDKSTCRCSVGGKISIIKSAQSFSEEVDGSIYQPINYTPDNGRDEKYNGYYYNYNGNFEEKVTGQKNGNESDVYACNGKGSEKDTFINAKKLKIIHSDFQRVCNIVKHEGLSDEENEYLFIAHANYNEGKDKGTTMLARLMTGYSSVDIEDKKTQLSDTAIDTLSRYSRKGVIDALLRDIDTSKADPTDGARFWDGVDFLAWGIDTELKADSSSKTGHNKFDEYDFIKIKKSFYDEFVTKIKQKYPNGSPYKSLHNAKTDKGTHLHKETKRGSRAIYAIPASDFSRKEYWTTGDFYYKNKTKQATGIIATQVAGYSIFWKEIK